MFNPKTKDKVVSVEEIKRVNLEHCEKVLMKNVPTVEAEKLTCIEEELHAIMM